MRRCAVATLAVLVALTVSVSLAFASWPTTCLTLNDQSEAALGNHGNVGIYQRAYGTVAEAEAACRRDHRDDVRTTFAWAMDAPRALPAATPAPTSSSTTHPDYPRVRDVANARSSNGTLADAIAADVIRRGSVDAFLRGTDGGVQYGEWPCEWRTTTCPLAPEQPPEPPPSPPSSSSGPFLDPGLDLAWNALRRSEFGSQLLRVRGADRVREIWWVDDLPGDALAGWAPANGVIGINTKLRAERPEALAALIAHEVWHAVSPIPNNTFDQCIADEVRAFITQAAVWLDLRPGPPSSRIEQRLDQMVDVWLNDPGDLSGRMVLEDVSGFPGLRDLALYTYDYATICAA